MILSKSFVKLTQYMQVSVFLIKILIQPTINDDDHHGLTPN
jgi:hypothetical protein